MTAAFAPQIPDTPAFAAAPRLSGAQNLLTLRPSRQFYLAEAAAVAIYALILAAGLSYTSKPLEAPVEEPMELVMEAAPPPPIDEPKPAEPEPPPPVAEEPPPPPPPVAEAPPVAPVEPPPPPKPVVRKEPPKPKPKPAVERPAQAARTQQQAVPGPTRVAPPPPGATPSAIANQIHARLAAAASNAYPESQKPRSARVNYRVSIDASGHVTSFTVSPSGNAAFDAVASRLGGRIGTVAAPGKPASLSGVINFAYR